MGLHSRAFSLAVFSLCDGCNDLVDVAYVVYALAWAMQIKQGGYTGRGKITSW